MYLDKHCENPDSAWDDDLEEAQRLITQISDTVPEV
jgi:hypothetical protein